MFKFFKKLFTVEEFHIPDGLFDDKYNCIEVKKNKLTREEKIYDELFYIHDSPTSYPRNQKMPSHLETPDNINTSQVEVIDQKTGKKIMMDANQVAQMQQKVPDGINVPGVGKFGSKGQSNQQKRPSQPQGQQPSVTTQRPTPAQQVPIPPQQGYPQQLAPSQYQNPTPQYQQPQQQPPVNGYPQQQEYNVVPNWGQQPQQVPVNQGAGSYLPSSEIAMIEGAYHVYIDLPGVAKDSLKVSFNAGTLNISGERTSSVEALRKEIKGPRGRKDPILTEHITVPPFLHGKFDFKYPFQRLIDESKLEANLENGILHVKLPHRIKGEEVSIPIM